MIALVGVAVLAAAGVAVAVLSAVAIRHPDRAAMLVVLAAAGGGVLFLFTIMLGLMTVGFREQDASGAVSAVVRYHPPRLAAGLTLAVVLLAGAAWLIRFGDRR